VYEYRCTLIRVVDADTVRLTLDLGFYLKREDQSYRLLRIDAPEMSTVEGKAAKVWLEQYLVGKSLLAQTQKSDSFGRFLAELYADGSNVSDAIVAAGQAVYKVY
jgi:micrococcal nuclease